MPAKNYPSTRFSGLDEITRSNVSGLQVAWMFSTGALRGHEAAPLVVDGTMSVVTPYPNIVYALDLTKPGAPTMEGWFKAVDARSGEVLWQFKTGSGIIGNRSVIVIPTVGQQWPFFPASAFRYGLRGRKFADVSEDAIYWNFVLAAWLPNYVLTYLVPRWL